MEILIIGLVLLVAFNTRARLFARKGFNFLVELVGRIGLSQKVSKVLVNIIILAILLELIF